SRNSASPARRGARRKTRISISRAATVPTLSGPGVTCGSSPTSTSWKIRRRRGPTSGQDPSAKIPLPVDPGEGPERQGASHHGGFFHPRPVSCSAALMNERILIVDDTPANLQSLSAILKD